MKYNIQCMYNIIILYEMLNDFDHSNDNDRLDDCNVVVIDNSKISLSRRLSVWEKMESTLS